MESTDPFVAPVRLASVGVARFAGAAFLAVWLCGWAAGECFAGAVWLGLLCEWIMPGVLASVGIHAPVIKGPGAIAVFAFLSFWLTFWTFGGLGAIDALLRSLWGSDELRIESGRLIAIRRSGPFTSQRIFEQGALRALNLRRKDHALMAADARGEVAIAELGTREQRTALRAALRSHLLREAPSEASATSGADGLPEGWRSDYDLEGRTVVHRRHPSRPGWAAAGWLIAGLLMVGGWQIASGMFTEGNPLGSAVRLLMLTMFVLLVLAGAAWLQFGRSDLIVSASHFGRRRHFGRWDQWTDFGPPRLKVEVRTDSDGDEWFELVAGTGSPRHVLVSTMNESGQPISLGRWMANRLGITLELDPRATDD